MNESEGLETSPDTNYLRETEGKYPLTRLEIIYNPYTFIFNWNSNTLNECSLAQTKRIINRNNGVRRIGEWFYSFLDKFDQDYNEDGYVIKFISSGFEIETVQEVICQFCEDRAKKIIFEPHELQYEGNVILDLVALSNRIRENGPNELRSRFEEGNLFDELEHLEENQVSIVVAATMSAGKSTLVNALLGIELLPSKNEACTATICKITDIDGKKDFDAVVKNINGDIIEKADGVSTDFLKKVNEQGNQEFIEILLQGDIPGISSDYLTTVLVDTPGPNNSQNSRHKEITYSYLKDNQNKPLILYVLNATQLKTTDDLSLLQEISEFIEENGKAAEDRIIFVLNRIDAFKPSSEPVHHVIQNARTYLREAIGIENPKIFPMSAEFAKLSILQNSGHKLDRDQEDELHFLRRRVLPDGDYEGIDTIAHAPIFQEQKMKLYQEARDCKYNASLHYSGLTALKLYINNYIARTHEIVLAHNLIKKIHPVLKEVRSDLKAYSQEEILEMEGDIEKLMAFVKTEGPQKILSIIEELKAIKPPTNIIHGISKKMEVEFSGVLRLLSNEKATETESKTILKKVNRITKNLEISIETSVQSNIIDGLKRKSDEIKAIMENELKDLINQMDLSTLSHNILSNKVSLNFHFMKYEKLKTHRYERAEVVGKKNVSISKWYNPLSWGKTIEMDVIENKEYYKLSNFQQNIREQKNIATNYLKEVNSEIQKEVETLKKEAIRILDKVEGQLEDLREDLIQKQELYQNTVERTKDTDKKMQAYEEVLIKYTGNE